MPVNKESMEGYRPPYVAGIQKGELFDAPFLEKAAQVGVSNGNSAEIVLIPKKWPDPKGYKPIIPTKSAFNALTFESIESIKERWCI